MPCILSTEEKVDKCGNCYGSKDGCCNTCDDVKRAYLNRGWTFNPVEIKQCEHQVKLEDWKEQNSDDGGCQLLGKLELNRLSGHFHIAPHKVYLILSFSKFSFRINNQKIIILETTRCG